MYKISRKAAAKLLKVSVRTVDRYITSNKLSTERRDNRIWLDRKEILQIKNRKQVDSVEDDMSIDFDDRQYLDNGAADVDSVSTSAAEISAKKQGKSAGSIYKKLYEETHEELGRARDRLEGANYRVGQLEALVEKSVPLLDHQRLLGEEKALRLELEENVESLREKLQSLKKQLSDEKFSRKMYLVILFVILLLQPLWLFLIR